MKRLEIKIYNLILTGQQQKYQYYHQVKLTNMNILQMKNNYLLIKVDFEKLLKKIIKTTKDQKKKKQADVLKFLNTREH